MLPVMQIAAVLVGRERPTRAEAGVSCGPRKSGERNKRQHTGSGRCRRHLGSAPRCVTRLFPAAPVSTDVTRAGSSSQN